MYKVFFNQKPLILTNKIQYLSDTEPLLFIKYTSVTQIIKALKSSKNSKVFLYHKDMDKLWKGFKKKFPIVEAAGGLVKRTDNKLLFIFRNDKERIEDFSETEPIHIELMKTYTLYGMPPIIVPKLSVEERIFFIKNYL